MVKVVLSSTMGLAIGAVIIRKGIHKFNVQTIVKDWFGPNAELNETDIFTQHFDTRKDDCIAIYERADLIIINNSRFTSGLYNPENIGKLYHYFRNPVQIFAFENYDSGGTYSFAVIDRGKLVRWVRSTADSDTPSTFGAPLNIELKIWHAQKIKRAEADGETYTYFIHPETKQLFLESDIARILLYEVMKHEVDLTPDIVYDRSIKRRYFKLIK